LPGTWASGPLADSLQQLSVSGNRRLGGGLPQAWGNMSALATLAARNCSLSGPLPYWGGTRIAHSLANL
jgi:hypothetical protein